MNTSKTAFKTIGNFLYQENKIFVIPNYQRGYKWSVKEEGKSETAVQKLMDDLIKAEKNQEYFLQGVTVSEEGNNIVLIDGQQRTTTLYFLLWCLNADNIKNIKLEYDIREKSKEFIYNLKYAEKEENQSTTDQQDIFYFKEAIKQIKNKLEGVDDLVEFQNFLLEKVTILYIIIEPDKATKTFTMMNGNKATMLQEELVKAEILRKISLPDLEVKQVSTSIDDNLNDLKEIIALDWETNALRSRYAREWDKWLYWWNRKDVIDYFGLEKPLGLLLDFYAWKNKQKTFSFQQFKNLITANGNSEKQKTKLIFKQLRDVQKSFEDIFNTPKIHNYLKMGLLCSSDKKDGFEIIKYFMENKNAENLLRDYAKWRLVGATHLEVTNLEKSTGSQTNDKEEKANEALNQLSKSFVYYDSYDLAIKQLLWLNVEEDNKLDRKFDFSIYSNKSLEHIHPKSKVYHKQEVQGENGISKIEDKDWNDITLGETEPTGEEWLNLDIMDKNCSEHCIGNLVLLDKYENSKFKDKSFRNKKEIYFNVKDGFKSRNLLHTISVFAKSEWGGNQIKKNQEKFIERFEQDYGVKLYNNDNDNE